LHQLDSADRQEPSLARTTKSTRLKEKLAKLKEEMKRLKALDVDAQGADGSNPLPDEEAATRGHRDGAPRPRLQSHARHQHHGARTADCSDQDVAPAVRMSLLTRFHRSKCTQHVQATITSGTAGLLRSAPQTPTAGGHLATSRFRTAWTLCGHSHRIIARPNPLRSRCPAPVRNSCRPCGFN
jgi:hypothetical protein